MRCSRERVRWDRIYKRRGDWLAGCTTLWCRFRFEAFCQQNEWSSLRGVGDIAILLNDEPGPYVLDHQQVRRKKTNKCKYPPSLGRHRRERQSSSDAQGQGHVLAGVPAWRWDMKPDDNLCLCPSPSLSHTHPLPHLVRNLRAGTSKAGFRMSRQSINSH